jgi:hypothetical protein
LCVCVCVCVWKHYENVPPAGREGGGCVRTERRRTPARVQSFRADGDLVENTKRRRKKK